MTPIASTAILVSAALLLTAAWVPKPKHHFHTEITIDAPADQVWAALTDTDRFPSWNPLVTQLEGKLQKGTTLQVTISSGDGSSMDFTPEVIDVQEGREFTWLGKLGVRGIFDGKHRFAVEDLGDGRSKLTHEEHFSGLLVPLLRKKLDRDSLPLFEAMNLALKARVENSRPLAAR